MKRAPSLTPRQARLVIELSRTPGAPVRWEILADAIGEPTTVEGKYRTQGVVQAVRRKFGREAIRTAPAGTRAGYYLPRDWSKP